MLGWAPGSCILQTQVSSVGATESLRSCTMGLFTGE